MSWVWWYSLVQRGPEAKNPPERLDTGLGRESEPEATCLRGD